jgi:hypothetical protein
VQKSKIGLGTKRPASSSININHSVKRQKVPQIEQPSPLSKKNLHQTTLAVSAQIQEYEHDPKLANEMSQQNTTPVIKPPTKGKDLSSLMLNSNNQQTP